MYEVLSTTKFEENSDLSTTYLGVIDMIRASKIIVEEKFPISEQGYTVGKLLDGRECDTFRHGSEQIIHVKGFMIDVPLVQ